mmetsp:Transcript_22719/g.45930  ORF Transcript_22719/g.45930 Transcript_22719/m.45930 type:complete len:282 (-) Transcript_22719:499-1344(-)
MAWTCSSVPAMTFEIANQESFRIAALLSRINSMKTGSAPASITACVCSSVPETTFPNTRSASLFTLFSWCSMSLTRRGMTPKSTTTWMSSLFPSESAASAVPQFESTSESSVCSMRSRVGSMGRSCSTSGFGLPRHKFENSHVQTRVMVSVMRETSSDASSRRRLSTTCPPASTSSRRGTESPEMFPSPHSACSRTSARSAWRSLRNAGITPCCVQCCVCVKSPETTLASAHAASSWRSGCAVRSKKEMRGGITPASITAWMGREALSVARRRRSARVPSI